MQGYLDERIHVQSEVMAHALIAHWPYDEMTERDWYVWSGLHIACDTGYEMDESELSAVESLIKRGYVIRKGDSLYLPSTRAESLRGPIKDA